MYHIYTSAMWPRALRTCDVRRSCARRIRFRMLSISTNDQSCYVVMQISCTDEATTTTGTVSEVTKRSQDVDSHYLVRSQSLSTYQTRPSTNPNRFCSPTLDFHRTFSISDRVPFQAKIFTVFHFTLRSPSICTSYKLSNRPVARFLH